MGPARRRKLVRWSMGVVVAAGVLAPELAAARTPLPTVEVVQPKKRLRVLDVRGPVQFGWGWSNVYRAPAYSMSFEA